MSPITKSQNDANCFVVLLQFRGAYGDLLLLVPYAFMSITTSSFLPSLCFQF